MSDKQNGFTEDATNALRGLCMGAADIVPGVSGGTIALILGHYERLVAAIGNVDVQLVRLLKERKWGAALERIDARFLAGLGAGIAVGVVALASLMHYLLEHQQAYIYAVFFGLILGSTYLVAQRMRSWKWQHLPLAMVGGLFAWWISSLDPMQGMLNPLTAFLAATVAICAMILPGISGAFVLLLLGLYHPITDLIKGLPRGQFTVEGLAIIAAFGAGCAVGLLMFTKLLKWLLARHHDSTMAFLVGLMFGSLVKIWPFQRVVAETADLPFKDQRFERLWPMESLSSIPLVITLMLASMAGTLLLEVLGQRLARRSQSPPAHR
jgi:putative membrane protein